MLAILIVLLLWIFAIIGYGSLVLRVIRRISSEETTSTLDLLHPLLGIGVLSVAVNLVNFFLPISEWISTIFLLIGLALFIKNYQIPKKTNWGMIIFAAIWLLAIAWVRSLNRITYYDSGLYGLQLVRWLQTNPLPLGLTNLHGRLGLNSAWFSFASVIQLPFILAKTDVANEFLTFFSGLAIFSGIQGIFRNDWNTNNVFLALMSLFLITPVLRTFSISPLINDVPIFWLTISEGFILINIIKGDIKAPYALLFSFSLAFLAITIKLSAIALLFVPVTIFILRFEEFKESKTKILSIAKWIVASGITFCAPWATRSFLLSGCWIYPLTTTCKPRMFWSVPLDKVELISMIIRAWAREENFDYTAVLSNWNWVSKWLPVVLNSTEVVFILFVLAFSVIFLIASQIGISKKNIYQEWIVQLPFYLGVIVWFLSAPPSVLVLETFGRSHC